MKNVKSAIGFIFLVGVCLTSLWAEYDLAMRFPIMFSVASISGLLLLLGALLRAPDGYEDENGFHILTRRETSTSRLASGLDRNTRPEFSKPALWRAFATTSYKNR